MYLAGTSVLPMEDSRDSFSPSINQRQLSMLDHQQVSTSYFGEMFGRQSKMNVRDLSEPRFASSIPSVKHCNSESTRSRFLSLLRTLNPLAFLVSRADGISNFIRFDIGNYRNNAESYFISQASRASHVIKLPLL